MKNIGLLSIVFLLLAASCGVPQADFDKLKEENEKLKKEIAECELTPAQILEQAKEYYDALDYAKSRDKLKVLLKKYPNSNEGKKAKNLLRQVEEDMLGNVKKQDKKETSEEEENDEGEEHYERNKKALAKMKKKYDLNNDVTWYTDKSSEKFKNINNSIQIYVGKKEDRKPWIGLSINHFTKKNWLFIKQFVITADGKVFTLEEKKPGEFNAKEESGGKREWLDRVMKKEDLPMIKKIAKSKNAKIKLVGKEKTSERKITSVEKKAFQNVLNAYEALGGAIK